LLKILSPGQKRLIFRHFSPFFSYVAPAMRLQKRKNCQKISLFLPPAENFEQALSPSGQPPAVFMRHTRTGIERIASLLQKRA
jgi:hypothetical protein